MDALTLQEEYDFIVSDAEFRKNYQKFLTPEFLTFWIDNFGRPKDYDNKAEYFTKLSYVLIGWKARGQEASNNTNK